MFEHEKLVNQFKMTMQDLPVPVAIITASCGNTSRGITVSSLTSLSLNPPLISFNITCGSQFCTLVENTENYVVHIPNQYQEELCRHFAKSNLKSEEQFKRVSYHRNSQGIPVLNAVSATLSCRLFNRFKAGDHLVIAAEVLEIDKKCTNNGLLYHKKLFKSI